LAAIAVAKAQRCQQSSNYKCSDAPLRVFVIAFNSLKNGRGRRFYNDSKATNIEATTVALQSFEQPLVLIAGGLDRGFVFRRAGSAAEESMLKHDGRLR
jgi:UDP-N-acetylmuramoylalanine--D-glutamate ligase